MLRNYSHRSGRQPKIYVKSEAAITVLELLMMGSVSPETCWEIKKHWNNKFYYTVASCWLFLWNLYFAMLYPEPSLMCLAELVEPDSFKKYYWPHASFYFFEQCRRRKNQVTFKSVRIGIIAVE
jgi:hypothetical protein